MIKIIKVVFVCHGNICRSPMAEFLFKDMVKKKGKEYLFLIESKATSSEEIGNSVHYGTKRILNKLNIDCSGKTASRIIYSDYQNYDYIIGMDEYNIMNLKRIFNDDKHKIFKLLEFCNISDDISDPWYTGDFERTYQDIKKGLEAFYDYLVKKSLL